jgi:ABC-type antimicrobial peptide transport system permease subunit
MLVDEWLNETRVIAVTLALLGFLALGLSVTGLYGMVAFSVAQRTSELGIRMILGAGQGAIRLTVMRSFLVLCGMGLAIGLLISGALGLIMRSQLMLLKVSWLPSVLLIVILLAVAVVLASYVPARRATSIEPAAALRCE